MQYFPAENSLCVNSYDKSNFNFRIQNGFNAKRF